MTIYTLFDHVFTFANFLVQNMADVLDAIDAADRQHVTSHQQVERLQDEAQMTLRDYVTSRHPGAVARFGRLMLILPRLRSLERDVVADLYFRHTLGAAAIERLIRDVSNHT